jgi:hypothetical protein
MKGEGPAAARLAPSGENATSRLAASSSAPVSTAQWYGPGAPGVAAGELVRLRDGELGLCVQLLANEVAVAPLDAPARFGVGERLDPTGRLAEGRRCWGG